MRRFGNCIGPDSDSDAVAVESPLEIRIDCNSVAITMRTPGDDAHLAIGFLLSEGVLKSPAQVNRVVVASGSDGDPNIANVMPQPDATLELVDAIVARRGTLITSACGVCGRERVDDIIALCEQLRDGPSIAHPELLGWVDELTRRQPVFAETGGVHGAALMSRSGVVLASAEDVGRHNAVDKVLGAAFVDHKLTLGEFPVDDPPAALLVSGRASFEIVQKAVVARVPVVVSVSAASSLAIELAQAMNLTLCAFAREGRLTVYTGYERVS